MDREELEYLAPYKYVVDLFRYRCVVRRKGGRAGVVKFSEVWRNARFGFEFDSVGWRMEMAREKWWRNPFGMPFLPLSQRDKVQILRRIRQYDEEYYSSSRR